MPSFLERLKQQVNQRVRREFTPQTQDRDTRSPEQLPKGFGDRLKKTVQDYASKLSPVQERLLDPSAPLDQSTIKYRIRFAGKNNVLLFMRYNGQDRHVEPYSFRMNGKNKKLRFFGLCRVHDAIHSFNPDKIQGLIVTNIPFNPRWPVEFD